MWSGPAGASGGASPLNHGPLPVLLEVDYAASTLGTNATVEVSRLCAGSYGVEGLVRAAVYLVCLP